MSKYQDQLLRHIETHPDFIRPEGYRNEVLAMLREPIERPVHFASQEPANMGNRLPFDERYVTYVWFDALLNYVSALKLRGEGDLSKILA